MKKLLFQIAILIYIISGCSKPEVKKYTINGVISGGAGKFIKLIDMTNPGLAPDSIELDMGGKFSFAKESSQPGDYIFYFKNADYIRVTPLVNDVITINGNYSKLLASIKISGSAETEKISEILKLHQNTIYTIDTLNQHYMQNQLHKNLDSLIINITGIRDSVINAEKEYLQSMIENNPGTFASYIALSQKVGQHLNLFTIQNDLKYFEMVDTALYNRFDTITIVQMLHGYVQRGKAQARQNPTNNTKVSMIGKMAPNILLPNPYKDTLNLENLRGKYILVDFWGSWCRPCRLEHPNLRKAYWTYRKRGFDIFSVAIEHNKTDWKNTIREDKLRWKNHVSELNYMESKTAKAYNVKSLPANYLIDPEGKILAQNLFGDALLNKLSEIFPPVTVKVSTPVTTNTPIVSE